MMNLKRFVEDEVEEVSDDEENQEKGGGERRTKKPKKDDSAEEEDNEINLTKDEIDIDYSGIEIFQLNGECVRLPREVLISLCLPSEGGFRGANEEENKLVLEMGILKKNVAQVRHQSGENEKADKERYERARYIKTLEIMSEEHGGYHDKERLSLEELVNLSKKSSLYFG